MAIAANHADFIAYTNLFKANRARGLKSLEAMLNVPAQAESLIASPAALHVLLGSKDAQTPRLLDAIRASRYAERIVRAFMDSVADDAGGFLEAVSADALENAVSLSGGLDEALYAAYWHLGDFEERYFALLGATAQPARVRENLFAGFPSVTQEEFSALSLRLLDDVSPIVHTRRDELLHLVGATHAFPIDAVGNEGGTSYAVPEERQSLATARLIDLAHDTGMDGGSLGFTFMLTCPLYFGTSTYSSDTDIYYFYDADAKDYTGISQDCNPDRSIDAAMRNNVGNSAVLAYVKPARKLLLDAEREYWNSVYTTEKYPLAYAYKERRFWYPSLREIFGDGVPEIANWHTDEPGEQIEWFKDWDNFENGVLKCQERITVVPTSAENATQLVLSTTTGYYAPTFTTSSYCAAYSEDAINAASSSYSRYLQAAKVQEGKAVGPCSVTSTSASSDAYVNSIPYFCI